MSFEHYIEVGRKRLRCGYTTGTCAAAATQACGQALLGEGFPRYARVRVPAGIDVDVEVEETHRGQDALGRPWAECGVRKDAGQDADATDGALVMARVTLSEREGIVVEGGRGVGRVTRAGLDQPPGAAAINSIPRQMITEELERIAQERAWAGGFEVEVSVPEGEAIAAKTFNPKLGIEGGISILGTSGIVRPMSEDALIESIRLEMRVRRQEGLDSLVLVPGNYGADWACQEEHVDESHIVSCSNFLGEALDCAATLGFGSLVLVGHMGKLAKVAAGVMNTHSRVADCRAEVFCTHAALAGADRATLEALMATATTDEAIELLARADGVGRGAQAGGTQADGAQASNTQAEAGTAQADGTQAKAAATPAQREAASPLLARTLAGITDAIARHVRQRSDPVRCELVVFSKAWGELGRTAGAEELLAQHRVTQTQEDER